MKKDLLAAFEIATATGVSMPATISRYFTCLKETFIEVKPGVFQKETPNGKISFNETSVAFVESNGTVDVLFEIPKTEGMSFVSDIDKIALWTYIRICSEQRLNADESLRRWFKHRGQPLLV